MSAGACFQAEEPVLNISHAVSLLAGVLYFVFTFSEIAVLHISLNGSRNKEISLIPRLSCCCAELDELVFVALDKVNFNSEKILAYIGHRCRIH